MLFDLQGRRRRTVQIVFASLAFLMGGGLVLTGVGSDAQGGLLDAFIGDGGGGESDARKPFENQKKEADKALATNPKDQAALATLVRANFGLAGLETEEAQGQVVGYTDKGQGYLREADAAWGRYLATDPKRIDTGLAATALQIYNSGAVTPTDKERWVRPAREIAEQQNSADAYVNLFTVATQAGDVRTAGLAERKALSLTQSKDERATIKERIKSVKDAAASAPGAGGNGTAPQGP
jgi:hypothetical protein